MWHIYPVNDLHSHNLKGKLCICGPKVNINKGEEMVVHNAFDKREWFEPDYVPSKESLEFSNMFKHDSSFIKVVKST